MATKRHKHGRWEYRIRKAGVLDRPVYLTFADEAEGDAYVRRVEQLLDRGIVPPEFVKPVLDRQALLRHHVATYLDTHAVSADDAKCLRVLGDRFSPKLEMRALTYAWASSWVTSMKRDDNLSPGTIRHHVGALARCLDVAVAGNDIPVNPLRQLPRGYAQYTDEDARLVTRLEGGEAKESEERDRRLAADEEVRVRAVLAGEKPEGRQRAFELEHGDALNALFDLALESAMRLSEMYTLEVQQVDFGKRTVFLDRSKNGSKRQVPITTVAERVLRAYIGDRRGGWLFPWYQGGGELERRRCTSQLSRQFARVFSAAGCADLRFHDLRHEATSRIYERTTLTDLEIGKITGHRDPRSLARYANLRGSTLATKLW